MPGFVLYGPSLTVVVDMNGAVNELPGVWVLDDAASPPKVSGWVSADDCACEATCDGVPLAGAPTANVTAAPADPSDHGEECGWAVREPMSLVGGALQLAGEDFNGCDVNLYGYGSGSVQLATAGRPLRFEGEQWCEPEGGAEAGFWPTPAGTCRKLKGRWVDARLSAAALARTEKDDSESDASDLDDADPCLACERELWDSEVYFIRRGLIIGIRDDVEATSEAHRAVSYRLATPKVCPTAADPCGDPKRFRNVPALRVPKISATAGSPAPDMTQGDDFWIASDGSLALSVSLTPGAWALWKPGQVRPLKAGALVRVKELGLGARFHRDVAPILAGVCQATCGEHTLCPGQEEEP